MMLMMTPLFQCTCGNAARLVLCCAIMLAGCGSEFEILFDEKSMAAKDTAPPTIDVTSPGDGAGAVVLHSPVSITFSEPMNTGATEIAVSIEPAVTGTTFLWNSGNNILTISHDSFTAGNTEYTVTIGAGARDSHNVAIASPYAFSFTTVNTATEMRIYWSEKSGSSGSIKKTNSEKSNQSTLLITAGIPLDIALDPGVGIYWAEKTTTVYAIKNAGLDGTGEVGLYSRNSASFRGPTEIAVDPANELIYWNRLQIGSETSIICSSPFDSLNDNNCSSDLPYDHTFSMSLDPVNAQIYFSANTAYWDIDANAPLGTGKVGVMYRSPSEISSITAYVNLLPATGPDDPSVPLRDIVVDRQTSDGYVFFVIDSNTAAGPQIIRSNFDFTSQATWITADGFTIHKLALDLIERKIYWTSPEGNSIYRADADLPETGVELFFQGETAPTGIAIAN